MSSEQEEFRQGSVVHGNQTRRDLLRRCLQWGGIFALFAFGMTMGTVAVPQETSPVPPYCYKGSCSDTRTGAETTMRADPALQGQGAKLELVDTKVNEALGTAEYIYRLKPSKPEVVYGPMYTNWFVLVLENVDWWNPPNPQKFSCTPANNDPSPEYVNWCAQGEPLYNLALQNYQSWFNDPECINPTINMGLSQENTTAYPDYRLIFQNANNIRRGVAAYGNRHQVTYFDCHPPQGSGGKTVGAKVWDIPKIETFVCPLLYKPVETVEIFEPTTEAFVCRAETETDYIITGPFEQVDSECANANPCHPSTGDKSRAETDFSFAGRPFTRAYHSLRQLRGSVGFAEGWTHPYTDKVIRYPSDAVLRVMDDQGTYETFTSTNGTHYFGKNSVNRRLDVVNVGGIGYRLRSPDGEIKEFDGDGQLIAVRDTRAPQNDVMITRFGSTIFALTDARGRMALFSYRGDGLLSGIQLPDQSTVQYHYDGDGNLTSVDYGNGQIKQYHYHEAGLASSSQRHHLTGITDETGVRYASFGYDNKDRVTSSRVLGSPNDLTTLTYDSTNHVTVNTASGGARGYTMQPGMYRRILSVTESNGSQYRSYDAQGRLESVTDKRGVQTGYAYTDGYLSAVTEAVNTPQQRRMEFVRSPVTNLVTEQRVYDASNTLKAKSTIAYNARGQATVTTSIDPITLASRSSTAAYCEQSGVDAGTCPMIGLMTSVDGPRTDVTDTITYTYRMADEASCATTPATCTYRKGDLWKVTNGKGHVTEVLAYDAAGRVRSLLDVNAVTTDMEYSPRGWLTARKVRGTDNAVETDDRITRIAYTAQGLVERVTLPDGTYIAYGYDAGRRLTDIIDNAGNAIAYTLNGAGQRVKEDVEDANGTLRRTLGRSYNTLGELQAVLRVNPTDPDDPNPVVTSFTYDKAGNPDLVTDPLNRKVDQDHDPLGRLSQMLQDIGGIAAETIIQNDALDRVERVTDPKGLITIYTYNGLGDLLQLESPDTGITTYSYDEAGNRSGQIDANEKVVEYRYDALNRLKMVDFAAAVPDEVYAYDTAQADCSAGENFLVGRMSRMSGGGGSTNYCYNRFGDLVRKVQYTSMGEGLPSKKLILRYAYAANGRLIAMTYPDGTVVDYLYDSVGRVAEMGVKYSGGTRSVLLHNAQYHPFGPVSQWTYGNGRVVNRTLNKNGQPGIVQDAAAGGISYGYAFDTVGNLATLRNGHQADPALRTYQYDGLNRLTAVNDGGNGQLLKGYTYDKTGNRTKTQERITVSTGGMPGYPGDPGGTTTMLIDTLYGYANGSHQLADVAGDPRGYDNAGNQTTLGSSALPGGVRKTYAYNEAGRLESVTNSGGTVTMRYQYNGKGERARRYTDIDSTHSLYDEAGHWLGDYSNGSALQQVFWLGDLPVGLAYNAGNGNQTHYIEADALGTPRVVIETARDIAVWRWNLEGEAFGRDYPNEDADGDGAVFNFDMRFPGQRFDVASGLIYNYFRDYDPSTGRYSQSDPIGLDGGISTYGYVSGNPLTRIDPLGLDDFECYGENRVVFGCPTPPLRTPGGDGGVLGVLDFIDAYFNQLSATHYVGRADHGWANQDKYFHCKANCDAAQRGSGGRYAAECVSNHREAVDLIMGDRIQDSAADQRANRFGRAGGQADPKGDCRQICGKFRPGGSFPAAW